MSNNITPVTAPMVGKIIKVNVKIGDKISQNQPIIVFESMKMEIDIMASVAGTIKELNVEPGQVIKAEQVLATIET